MDPEFYCRKLSESLLITANDTIPCLSLCLFSIWFVYLANVVAKAHAYSSGDYFALYIVVLLY